MTLTFKMKKKMKTMNKMKMMLKQEKVKMKTLIMKKNIITTIMTNLKKKID